MNIFVEWLSGRDPANERSEIVSDIKFNKAPDLACILGTDRTAICLIAQYSGPLIRCEQSNLVRDQGTQSSWAAPKARLRALRASLGLKKVR